MDQVLQPLNDSSKLLDRLRPSTIETQKIWGDVSSVKNLNKKTLKEDTSFMCDDVTMPATNLLINDDDLDQTSAAILAQEDPGMKTAQLLFSEFVNIMVSHPTDALIWEEIAAYERVCSRQADILKKVILKVPRHHSYLTKTKQMALRLVGERNTWRLLGSLYYDRVNQDYNRNEQVMITKDRTDKGIISQLYETSESIREAQNVIDWLEKNAQDDNEGKYYDVNYFGANHIAWENTLKVTKNTNVQWKTGTRVLSTLGGVQNIVTSLDPDAPLRQGKPLHDLDQDEDQRLMHCTFTYLRSGQLIDAQELCAKSGQHWRAAIFEGWKLHHDSNLDSTHMRAPVSGNQYRDVWKAIAWKAASDERLPMEERATYGALCGHISAMLLMCHNWEDQLWAYFRTLVDQRVEETLRGNSLHLRTLHPLPLDYPEEKLTFEGVFKAIESTLPPQSQNSYHTIQKSLILNDIEGLVKISSNWIEEGSVSPHLLRCLTHLLLVLDRLGKVPYDCKSQMTDILHSCAKEAMERGDLEQIARYASVLPEELQVGCYSDFLVNIHDDHNRKQALSLASTVGLNIAAITTTVVTKIRLEPTSDMSNAIIAETTAQDKMKINAVSWLLYDKVQRSEALRQANAMMRHFLIARKMAAAKSLFLKIPVDSIDVIIKLHEAKTGLTELPYYYENRVREYLSYKTFLDAQESFTDWFDHYHQKKPCAPKEPKTGCTFQEQLAYDHSLQQHHLEYDRWKYTLDLISKKSCERLYNVVLFPDGGWLVDVRPLLYDDSEGRGREDGSEKMDEDDEDEEEEEEDSLWGSGRGGRRKLPLDMCTEDKYLLQNLEPELASRETKRGHQLTTLRSVYIPQVTSLLQNILHCTKEYKECMQLADLIASEKYGLYKCFGIGETQRFLFKLQETSKELLDMDCDALGYPLN